MASPRPRTRAALSKTPARLRTRTAPTITPARTAAPGRTARQAGPRHARAAAHTDNALPVKQDIELQHARSRSPICKAKASRWSPETQAACVHVIEDSPDVSKRAKVALEPCPFDAIWATGLAAVIATLIERTTEDENGSCFHSSEVPPISIPEYMTRIAKYFDCSGSCFVLALVYIDRLIRRNPQITINRCTSHRLLLTGMVVAAKFHDDTFFTNRFYANIGGVDLQDMNRMEAAFLYMIDFSLHVKPEEFAIYSKACQALAQDR